MGFQYPVETGSCASPFGPGEWPGVGDLVLYKQPIIGLSCYDGGCLGYEVLLRLKRPDGSMHSPHTFVRSAERAGTISLVDRRVFTATLDWLDEQDTRNRERAVFFINISGMSLRDDTFRSCVIERLRERRRSRPRICFELTESVVVPCLRKAAQFIGQVREFGHYWALDDFGSGVSSFAYLKHLPVDYLKIDGQIVRGINHDHTDLAMVECIANLAGEMGIRTIAEFAETDAVLDRLRHTPVDYAQGYAVGVPRQLASRRPEIDYGSGHLAALPPALGVQPSVMRR